MNACKKTIVVFSVATFLALIFVFLSVPWAGDLEPVDPPGPTMHTLEQIYSATNSQADRIYNKPIWKIWGRPFIDWPDNDRFALTVDGFLPGGGILWGQMVLDKETGLIWARNAYLDVSKPWTVAIDFCRRITISNRQGWRMPTAEELASLLDMSVQGSPKLPSGHPFENVQNSYWTSTTREGDSGDAWNVSMTNGISGYIGKGTYRYAWPVRGGNGYATGNW